MSVLLALVGLLCVAYLVWRLKRKIFKKNVAGQLVLVTGGASGLGRRMCLNFAKLGCRIVVWDINAQGLEKIEKELNSEKAAFVKTYVVDLSKRESIYAVAAKVKEECGKVDIVINNAGIVSGKPFLECTDEQIERTMNVNINAHFWIAKSFVPAMVAEKKGHLVTISSMAGQSGVRGLADYCASKFAAVGFDESLRHELSQHNVQTTCICPYYINTGMFDGVKSKFPLLPIMEESYAANRIVEAVLESDELVMLPWFANAMPLARLFPIVVQDWAVKILGISESMDSFKGRQSDAAKKAN